MWHEEGRFEGFGPNAFDPHGPRELQQLVGSDATKLRAAVRQQIPKHPGVYGMLDQRHRLIYVGKSKTLRSRLLSYFNPAVANEKAGRIIESTRHIVWETQPNEFAALLREQQLIRRWTPRWNVQEIPKRQRPVYLCLGRGPAAMFFLSRLPPKESVVCEGPFHGIGRMGRAVDALNKHFRLRDCKNSQGFHFSNQLSLFEIEHRPGCLRYEIGSCSGPCAGAVSLTDYNKQLQEAKSFLAGENDDPLLQMQANMEQAARDLNFEFAARLRDDIRSLEYLYRKLLWLAEARRRFTFVYSAPSLDDRPLWYLIRAGEVFDVMVAPQSPASYAESRAQLRQWQTACQHAATSGPYPHTLSLVASWFRKNSGDLSRTFSPHEAGRKYRSLLGSAVA